MRKDVSFCYIGSTNITVAKREYNRVAKGQTPSATATKTAEDRNCRSVLERLSELRAL